MKAAPVPIERRKEAIYPSSQQSAIDPRLLSRAPDKHCNGPFKLDCLLLRLPKSSGDVRLATGSTDEGGGTTQLRWLGSRAHT